MCILPDDDLKESKSVLLTITYNEGIMSDKKAVIKLTKTMLNKHIIDANASVREWAKLSGVDYAKMKCGEKHSISAEFTDGTETVLNLYRTNNARGDRRISIKGIKAQAEIGDTVTFTLKGHKVILEVLK